jgi:hypothetical protein
MLILPPGKAEARIPLRLVHVCPQCWSAIVFVTAVFVTAVFVTIALVTTVLILILIGTLAQ